MAEGFLSSIFGPKKRSSLRLEDYVDLDEEENSDGVGSGPADLYVKVAELGGLNDVANIKEEVYSGNVVLVDVSRVDDELSLERSIKELRRVVSDIDGDIAAMGNDQVIVTPTVIKIDREKIPPVE
ncbi:MAG: hypothetical protein MAG715_00451 [Methanonatronarchaeales archaeon]|nr:hypothetical protein [Methanonatronarchaeales archaeon]